MALIGLTDWMEIHSGPDIVWFLKRLSANDTQANINSHQAGPYIRREFLLDLLPDLNQPNINNPSIWFTVRIDSHPAVLRGRAVWYNGKLHGTSTRNEARITNWGGMSSPLLDSESTGALVIFAFHRSENDEPPVCHVWVCRNGLEEDIVEARIGPVEPGRGIIWTLGPEHMLIALHQGRGSCSLTVDEIPHAWLAKYPSGEEIVNKVLGLRPDWNLQVDERIVRRSRCEHEIFQSLEAAVELPRVQNGFQNVEDFMTFAQRLAQRRRSRAGRSLELHTRQIFFEEGLSQGTDFDYQVQTEINKKADFIFPSQKKYSDMDFPAERLRMLAVKRTLKDRWRQIINEANRIRIKHLLTLQEGVSENQFQEMVDENVQLVVPEPLIAKYPPSIRPHLQTLESFIGDVRLLTTP